MTTTTTTETFTFRTRATRKTSSELWMVVVDTHGGTEDAHDQMRDRVEQGWHATSSTLRIEGLTRRDVELLIEDLEYFASDTGWDPELMFRARPFRRMADELRELLRSAPSPLTTSLAHQADHLTEKESQELAKLMHSCGQHWLTTDEGSTASEAPIQVHRVEVSEGRWAVSVDFDPRAQWLRQMLAEQLELCVEEIHDRRAAVEAIRDEMRDEVYDALSEAPVEVLLAAARELVDDPHRYEDDPETSRAVVKSYVISRLRALGVTDLDRMHGATWAGSGERCQECHMVEAEQQLHVRDLDGDWCTLVTCRDCARGAS